MNLFGDLDLDDEMKNALNSEFVNNLMLGNLISTSNNNVNHSRDSPSSLPLPRIKVTLAESTLDIQLKSKVYIPDHPIDSNKQIEEQDTHHTLSLDDLDWNVCIDNWDKAINYDKYNKTNPTNYYMLLFPVPNYHLIHNMQHLVDDKCALLLDQNDPYLHIDYNTLTQPRKMTSVNDALSSIKQRFNGYMYQLNSVRQTMQYQLHHTDAAIKLYTVFYPLHYTKNDLRHYHRPPYTPKSGLIQFLPLKQRNHRKIQFAKDLLARDGRIILLEYSEEYPLLMQNKGMTSLMQNFTRTTDDVVNKPYGSMHNLEENEVSPLFGFGNIENNECITLLVNNLFRAPLVQHEPSKTDFLFIHYTYKQQSKYYIRSLPHIFIAGQQLPADVIQPPQSRKHLLMLKNRVKQAAFRLVQKHPKRVLHIDSLKHMLPGYSDSHLKSKLRDFMVLCKHKKNQFWGLKQGIIVPDDVDSLCTPEQVCLHHAMLAGEQRLRDLGFNSIKDDENDFNMELEEQVAGWILTRNFMNAVQGKCMLQLYGQGDPTGCGLGTSYIKTSSKDVFLRENETMDDRMKELSNRPKNAQKFTLAEQQNIYNTEINKIFNKQMEDLRNVEVQDVLDTTADSNDQQQDQQPDPMDVSDMSIVRNTKTLVITRKWNNNGEEEERQEIVRDPQVINQYLALKQQQQQQSTQADVASTEGQKTRKCRACGSTTHIKTSKYCPMNKNHGEHLEKERTKKRKQSSAMAKPHPHARKTLNEKLNNAFEKIIIQMTSNPECFIFNYPVTDDIAPNYSTEIREPMDFGTILHKCQMHKYVDKEHFMNDVDLIRKNCMQYNGEQALVSIQATKFVGIVEKKVKMSKKIPELEGLLGTEQNENTSNAQSITLGQSVTAASESSSDLEDLEALLNKDELV
eukprot:NODE_346_length_10492_cov_0.275955.p1 type:complete len:906 gc:universal NODE_346_length_10492_cov_0.275955:6295-9012(+)